MGEHISLPLQTISHTTYLGEIILKPDVYEWVKRHAKGAFRASATGTVTRSATQAHCFSTMYEQVKPVIQFEREEIAAEFRIKWCK